MGRSQIGTSSCTPHVRDYSYSGAKRWSAKPSAEQSPNQVSVQPGWLRDYNPVFSSVNRDVNHAGSARARARRARRTLSARRTQPIIDLLVIAKPVSIDYLRSSPRLKVSIRLRTAPITK